ncbi:glutaredoxin family protein [Candidatus Woesearchaeota archaeon]|nr:glutaredoxin family protein [Candidatus Woesearchaeota archaeon]
MTKVEIFTTPTCIHCKHTKEFFKKHNVNYIEHNVIQDRAAAKMMIEKTAQQGVPVTVIDGNWDDFILGFDESKLRKKLEIKR